jgi:hypothetical protein
MGCGPTYKLPMLSRTLLAGGVACLTLLNPTGPAYAQMRWAHQYLEPCSEGSPNRPLCLAFVDGFLRGTKFQAQQANTRLDYCLPENIRAEEVADAYHAFMEKHRHFQSLDAAGLLGIVLSTMWGCRQS